MSPIDQWRCVLHHAASGKLIPPDTAGWLVGGGSRYVEAALAGEPIALDVALGLGAPGRHGWWTEEARQRRDAALRELRCQRFAHLDDAEAARQIWLLIRSKCDDPTLTAALATGLGIPGVKRLTAILRRGKSADA